MIFFALFLSKALRRLISYDHTKGQCCLNAIYSCYSVNSSTIYLRLRITVRTWSCCMSSDSCEASVLLSYSVFPLPFSPHMHFSSSQIDRFDLFFMGCCESVRFILTWARRLTDHWCIPLFSLVYLRHLSKVLLFQCTQFCISWNYQRPKVVMLQCSVFFQKPQLNGSKAGLFVKVVQSCEGNDMYHVHSVTFS